MTTAMDESADIVTALGLGANDYATKPLDFDVIVAKIRMHLTLKHSMQKVLELESRLTARNVELELRIAERTTERDQIWMNSQDLLAVLGAGGVFAAIALIAIAYGSLNTYYGLVYSAIQDIVAPSMRGTAMAIYFMAMYLCGASFGPLLTGRLSDLMARRAADAAGAAQVTEAFKAIGLQQAMFIIPILSLLLAVVLYCGARTIVADMRKREVLAASSTFAD